MAGIDSVEAARSRGNLRGKLPTALAASYDRESGRVMIHLSSKVDLSFLPRDVQGLETATPADLAQIEISPSGLGIHFPRVDADVYVPGLLEGALGSRSWMAARLGAAGGSAKSFAKKKAARANGRLGGRPKRAVVR